MGLLSKKKETIIDVPEALKNMGYEHQKEISAKTISRSEAKRLLKKAEASRGTKDMLIGKLNDLSNKMVSNPDLKDCVKRLNDSIFRLKDMPDCSDFDVVPSIDSLLLAEIDSAIDDCEAGRYECISKRIVNIDNYIIDRKFGPVCYKDPKYCQCISDMNRFTKSLDVIYNQYNILENKRVELVAEYKDPNCKIDKIAIGNELLDIKEQQDKLSQSMDLYNKRLDTIYKYVYKIEDDCILNSGNFDYDDIMDVVIEREKEVEAYRKFQAMLSGGYYTANDLRMCNDGDSDTPSKHDDSKYDGNFFDDYFKQNK